VTTATRRRGSARSGELRRYAALLRGVNPMNAKMSELQRCFEAAGFADVKTILSSGNVVFNAPEASEAVLARTAEAAMEKGIGRSFPVIVRTIDDLRALLASDPYKGFRLGPSAKRVVTFLQQSPRTRPSLPIELDSSACGAGRPSPRTCRALAGRSS
jgi:uncharacterized protein (DUF1697 family)